MPETREPIEEPVRCHAPDPVVGEDEAGGGDGQGLGHLGEAGVGAVDGVVAAAAGGRAVQHVLALAVGAVVGREV